ncbi:MAG: glycosyltransferase family 1 protein [Anaerolineales bacterium]|nr:glycosyltransferase family 1 protein [Anaerolineales bacterium]
MKIALLHVFSQEGWTSIDVYSRRVAEHLERLSADIEIIQVKPEPWSFPDLKVMMPYGRRASLRTLGLYLSRLIKYAAILRSTRADVYHILDNSYGHLTNFLDPQRTVVTYHGASNIQRWAPKGPAQFVYSLAYKGMLRANSIVTVSEFTRNEIIQKTDYPPERVIPIYPGLDPAFRIQSPSIRKQFRANLLDAADQIILLHVGHSAPRKNVELLYRVVAILKEKGGKHRLIRIGRISTRAQLNLIDELNIETEIIHKGQIPNLDLPPYYASADLFIFPSFYEGFGLPLIEAMACGTPVICSDSEVFHEICGPAAKYADPEDPYSFADVITQLLQNPILVNNMRGAALEQVKRFDWGETARKLLAVYRSISAA